MTTGDDRCSSVDAKRSIDSPNAPDPCVTQIPRPTAKTPRSPGPNGGPVEARGRGDRVQTGVRRPSQRPSSSRARASRRPFPFCLRSDCMAGGPPCQPLRGRQVLRRLRLSASAGGISKPTSREVLGWAIKRAHDQAVALEIKDGRRDHGPAVVTFARLQNEVARLERRDGRSRRPARLQRRDRDQAATHRTARTRPWWRLCARAAPAADAAETAGARPAIFSAATAAERARRTSDRRPFATGWPL